MNKAEQYLNLYSEIVPVQTLKPMPDSEEYKVFMLKTGQPVKLGSVKKHLEHIPHDQSLYTFFQKAGIFWMIPIDDFEGNIYGYVMRSLQGKEYRTVFFTKWQCLYGWNTFEEFKTGDPIILVEGAKDNIVMQTKYPYSLALATNFLSPKGVALVKTLTNKVILGLDNDPSALSIKKEVKARLESAGIQVADMTPFFKDWGQYITKPPMMVDIDRKLNIALRQLERV